FETLAELGPPGLALLLATLVSPLVAAVRARRHPLVPAASGAYVALLAHAGVDWDWEMTAVTLTGLFCGAALLVAARGRTPALSAWFRGTAVAVTVVLGTVAYVGLRGNQAIASSQSATGVAPARSAAAARDAERWAPWSTQAKQLLAAAQLAQGDRASARKTLGEAGARDAGGWGVLADPAVAGEGAGRRPAPAAPPRPDPLDS